MKLVYISNVFRISYRMSERVLCTDIDFASHALKHAITDLKHSRTVDHCIKRSITL